MYGFIVCLPCSLYMTGDSIELVDDDNKYELFVFSCSVALLAELSKLSEPAKSVSFG